MGGGLDGLGGDDVRCEMGDGGGFARVGRVGLGNGLGKGGGYFPFAFAAPRSCVSSYQTALLII